jgi:hypothetical protein
VDDKLGQILIEMNLISREQLQDALIAQQQINLTSQKKFKLGEVLLFAETIRLPDLQAALRKQTFKADQSRDLVVAAKRKQREDQMEYLKNASGPSEDTFLGRLKSFFRSPK